MAITGTHAVMPKPYVVGTEQFDLADIGPGQVLIETEASAISAGTELAIYTGIHQWLKDPNRAWPKFPFVPGYSGVGHILAIGPDVEQWKVGERVIWAARHESHALVNVRSEHGPIWRIGED